MMRMERKTSNFRNFRNLVNRAPLLKTTYTVKNRKYNLINLN